MSEAQILSNPELTGSKSAHSGLSINLALIFFAGPQAGAFVHAALCHLFNPIQFVCNNEHSPPNWANFLGGLVFERVDGMRNITLIVLLVGLNACEAQRTQRWNEDLDFWIAEVKRQHYVYKSKPLPAEFQLRTEKLRANIQKYSDQQMVIEILGLSALLGDGHTYVLPWGGKTQVNALPFRFYWFADGLFILQASPGYKDYIGQKVKQLGSVSAEEAMRRVARYVSRDNDQGINWIGPFILSFEGVLQAIEVNGMGSYSLTLESEGKVDVKDFPVVPYQASRGVPKLSPQPMGSAPLYLQKVNQNFWIQTLAMGTLYVQFNQVMDDRQESLSQFASRLADSIKVRQPKKLIVDVRHNNGGNADLLGPLLETLYQFGNKRGNVLYVLTGRNTFSAAQIFISQADRLLKPIFAGEASSSRPNFVGEENGVVLPNSGTICSISNRYHESIPGDNRSAIEPQIKIELTSTDYFRGRDPVLDAVIKRDK